MEMTLADTDNQTHHTSAGSEQTPNTSGTPEVLTRRNRGRYRGGGFRGGGNMIGNRGQTNIYHGVNAVFCVG
jgi:hypothetical protein